ASWKVILPRQADHEYDVDHRGDLFYIRTNKGAKNFRVVTAPVSDPSEKNWKEFVAHRPAVKIDGVDLFSNQAVLSEWENGLKQTEVPGGFDKNNYKTERVFATASDGTKIPMSIVYRKTVKLDGSAPLLLYGYGSYGLSIPPSFSASRLALLDRGVVFVIAHIRGGGELGEPWRDAGRMMNKINTFTDFIACAEHLVNNKYTSKDRIAIQGGSAGGMLMGAVTNMRPDLFKAVVAQVPFVDVL